MPGQPQGAVFGFDVSSPFDFQTLRVPSGLDVLEIVPQALGSLDTGHLPIVDVVQPQFAARIYHDGVTYRLWVDGVGWFDVDPRVPRITVPVKTMSAEHEELIWGVPALLSFLDRGDCSLHAAAVEVAGEAIVFVAPHAHGKSTLAAAFARRGFRVLSEDLTCVRLESRPAVVPGPAALRLRNDVAGELGIDRGRRLNGRHERTRYALTNPGDCRPVPILALLLLSRCDDGIRLEPEHPMQSISHLWQSSFRVTRAHEHRCFEAVCDLAKELPILRLHRPLRLDALDATVDSVLESFSLGVRSPRSPVRVA